MSLHDQTTKVYRRPAVEFLHRHERVAIERGMMPERRATIRTTCVRPHLQPPRDHRPHAVGLALVASYIGIVAVLACIL